MINMTEAAIKQAKTIRINLNKENYGLRVGVVGGGCSGLSYKLDFEDKAQEKDRVVEFDGLQVFIDPKAYLFLANIEIDYHADMMSSGFTFKNPDAKTSCGCGTSFSV